MPEFLENALIGIRQWVGTKLERMSYVISSHINQLHEEVSGLTTAVAGKQNILTAGNGITISGNTISADAAPMLTEITYADLVDLRDNGELVPGAQYRITDYETTTTQENTQSAGHAFDVIVVADSVDTLNENARAIKHSGDTYFENCDLSAWELKYCIDNDTTRFAWASSDGTGVIYYMKDEWNNVDWYDFKNIQFPRYQITECINSPDLEGQYGIDGCNGYSVDTGTTYWCYRHSMIDFNDDLVHDVSVESDRYPSDEGFAYKTTSNIAKPFYQSFWNETTETSVYLQFLPDNVFVTDTDLTAMEYDDQEDVYTYGEFYGFYDNTFGNSCQWNTFGNECYYNTFGNGFYNNTFGNYCYYNTFGNSCFNNTFGNYFQNNTFGNECYWNTFGNYCYRNTFGNDCNNNTFGNDCYQNTFGNGVGSNTFGNDCYQNTFGNNCGGNTFGNGFYNNTFGNYFQNNTFGNDYIRWCAFGDGVQYCSISGYTTGSNTYLQNIIVLNGTQGTSGNLLVLSGLTVSAAYSQTCGRNSSGTYTSKNILD